MARNTIQKPCGDWEMVKELGGGQFGKVTLWKNKHTKDQIAIKTCKQLESQNSIHSRLAERWQQEIIQTKNTQHENIVKYKEIPDSIKFGFIKDYKALGMEYCDEGDLRNMLNKVDNNCGLREYLFRDLMKDISGALDYLHNHNIIHRDLKPENIVLKKDLHENIVFKIIDLGYAKDISGQNHATSMVGTWHYLAPEFWSLPEQLYGPERNGRYHTKKVDFWSFGLVAFECITGRRPFYPHEDPAKVTAVIKKNKTDKHICTVQIHDSRYEFSSKIPSPNWLHEESIKKFTPWLQKMLMIEDSKRGGEDWHNELRNVLNETQIIYVFNTQTCQMVSFPSGLQRLRMKSQLKKLMNVDFDDQLICLFEDGNIPDPRKMIEDQCVSSRGPPRVLYVYTTERPFDAHAKEIPNEMTELANNSWVPTGGNPLHIFYKVICYVNQQFDQCIYTLKSLSTLNQSVKNVFLNCKEQGKQLMVKFNEFNGGLKMIIRNLEYCCDTFSPNKSDVEYTLLQQCAKSKEDMEKYKQQQLPRIQDMVRKIIDPVPDLEDTLYRNFNYVETNMERINERRRKWVDSALSFRSFTRQLRLHDGLSQRKENVELAQKACMKLSTLMDHTFIPLKEFSTDLLNQSTKSIESLVKAHRTIHSILCSDEINAVWQAMDTQEGQMINQHNQTHALTLHNLRGEREKYRQACDIMNDYNQNYENFARDSYEIQRIERGEDLARQVESNLMRMNGLILSDETSDTDWSFLDEYDDDGQLILQQLSCDSN